MTPLSDFDVLIHMRPSILPLYQFRVTGEDAVVPESRYRNLGADAFRTPLVGFDVAQSFLCSLKATFSQHAFFFHDSFSNVIGVVWKPDVFQPRVFSLRSASNAIPVSVKAVSETGKKVSGLGLVPDVCSILSQFELLGNQIIHSIELQ